MTAIRESELNAELQRLMSQCETKPSDDGYTVKELAEVWKVSITKADRLVADAVQQGLLRVEIMPRKNRINVVQKRPVYVPVKSKRK